MSQVIQIRKTGISVSPAPTARPGGSGDHRTYTDKRPREHLTEDEIEKMLTKVSDRHPERDKLLILLGFQHGLRAQEISTLAWPNIDFKLKTIKVARIKDSITTTQPISPRAIDFLKKWQEVQGEGYHYIFTWANKRIQPNAIWKL